jgi:tRNA 2-thiouridine synthesizing protein A
VLDVTEYEITETLDTSGLSCPLPVLKAKKALKKLDIGSILKIISTDPGSKKDIHAWARVTKQELLHDEEIEGKYVYIVKRMN